MKYLIVATIIIPVAAFAQQGPDVQSVFIQSLQAQRSNALDQAALLNAQLQVSNKALADLRTADDKLKAELAAAKKQIDVDKKSDAPTDPPKDPK